VSFHNEVLLKIFFTILYFLCIDVLIYQCGDVEHELFVVYYSFGGICQVY